MRRLPGIFSGLLVLGYTVPAMQARAEIVRSTMNTEEVQRVIADAREGAVIQFEPGKYQVTRNIQIPCRDLTITGPAESPPTVTMAATSQGYTIFSYPERCRHTGKILYIHFRGAGAVYLSGESANFEFAHNLVTNLPSSVGGRYTVVNAGVFIDGSLAPSTSTRHVSITDNTFGDPSSCSAVFATGNDEGGYCAGVITHTGLNEDVIIARNQFVHLEEGIHFLQLAEFKPGEPSSGCLSCVIEYNSIVNYHRMGIEIQIYTRDTMLIRHNAIVDPLGSYYGTFAVSLACCQWGAIQGIWGHSPALLFDDNVLIASVAGYQCPPYGVEFWGEGSQGTNNLVEGLFCNGFTWGYGDGPWAVRNNYICGPNFASRGGYISNQQHQKNPPIQSNNVTETHCSARASAAPTIQPDSGAFDRSQVVTLKETEANTGIWFTTDGTTPVPGLGSARLYREPFEIRKSTVVKAVGMWGDSNQPVRYPENYGYVPSRTVTASFSAKPTPERSRK